MGSAGAGGQARGMTKLAAIAAPALMLFYGLCRMADGFDGDRGNGIAWDIGHVAFFIAFVLFAFLAVGLRTWERRPRVLVDVATAASLFGIACFLWVIIGDLFDGWPALPDALEIVGPLLYQVGSLVVLIRLVVARRLPWWTPVLVLIGFGSIAVSLDLLPIASVLVGAGLAPIALSRDRSPATPAMGAAAK
jgi:hypothetical protein